MSLEKALEANTAAILALTEILNTNMAAQAAFPKDEPAPAAKKPEEKASAPSKAKAAPVAKTPASSKPGPGAETSTSPEPILLYDDIKVPFLNLAKTDLAAAQALIAEFGFKTLKDAKPEQYAEILAKLNANSEEGMA